MYPGGQSLFSPHLYYLYAANMPFCDEKSLSVWPTSLNLVAEDMSRRSTHQVRCRLNMTGNSSKVDPTDVKGHLLISPKPTKTGFSIDEILRKDTSSMESDTRTGEEEIMKKVYDLDEERFCSALADYSHDADFAWLQCTRYKPPKLPRLKKKDGVKKRKLGRNPRVPFTQHQVNTLEQKFRRTHYLSSLDVADLSGALNLTETRVKIWFQNRRARERREREGKQTVTKATSVLKNAENSSNDSTSSYGEDGSTTKGETSKRTTWFSPLPPTTSAVDQFTNAIQNGTSAFTPVSLNMT